MSINNIQKNKIKYNQLTKDSKDLQYLFAIKENEDWKIIKHKFQIPNKEKCFGQFISSTWYSAIQNVEKDLEFLVLGVHGKINYNNITNLVNGCFKSYNSNKLSTFERSTGILFKDYYCKTSKECKKIILKDDKKKYIVLVGEFNKSKLTLRTRFINGGIYNTTPDFELIVPS